MRSLSTIMPALTKDILGKRGILFGKMVVEWSNIMGDDLSRKAVPVNLKFSAKTAKGGKSQAVLHLAASSAASLELTYQKPLMIERLNAFFGYNAIKDIKFIHTHDAGRLSRPKRKASPAKPLPLTKKQEIDRLTAGIAENDLQTALKNLGKGILTRKDQ